jgi:D-psicose/D-tagatose/L-ribulose 3-epimerase
LNPLGANAWIWVSPLTDERLADLAPRVRAWGFDVLELPIEHLGDWDPSRAADVLGTHGLRATVAVAMGPGRELCAAWPEVVAETQEFLRGCVDAAVAVGAPSIAGPIYASTGRAWRMSSEERARCYEELREALAPVCAYAAERDVRVAIEPLVRYETSVINTVEQALEAIDDLPACGLLVDTYHANVEEKDLAAAFTMAGERLFHVHASANDRGAPGADHVDWPGFRDALRSAGYEGPVVIESFTAENETIATAASVWRPLAASQDAIAVDGLAFLRALLNSNGRP